MISKEDVQHIAKLARLELGEQETEGMQKDLSSILDYFNLLKKAKVSKKTMNVPEGNNVTRNDIVQGDHSAMAKVLIDAAPEQKDGYIKVKQIL